MSKFVFHNPCQGKMTLAEVAKEIVYFVQKDSRSNYDLIIGTDSKTNGEAGKTDFVTAVVIHRIGKGGRYFWSKNVENKIKGLHQRIYQEVMLSIQIAQNLLKILGKKLNDNKIDYHLAIHIDAGENGKSREVIKEVVGMVRGNGFEAEIKPRAYAASNVADRYT